MDYRRWSKRKGAEDPGSVGAGGSSVKTVIGAEEPKKRAHERRDGAQAQFIDEGGNDPWLVLRLGGEVTVEKGSLSLKRRHRGG